MIALLQLMLTALIAGAPTVPADVEMGGCRNSRSVPGLALRTPLVMMNAVLMSPDGGLEATPVPEGSWIGLACWIPSTGEFVSYDDPKPGISMVTIVSEDLYTPLNIQLERVVEAQQAHRARTGVFASTAADLGVEFDDLVALAVNEQDGWWAIVENPMLRCDMTSRDFVRTGELTGARRCGVSQSQAWSDALTLFWEAQSLGVEAAKAEEIR